MPTTAPPPANKPATRVAGTCGKVKATNTRVAGTFTFPEPPIIREYYIKQKSTSLASGGAFLMSRIAKNNSGTYLSGPNRPGKSGPAQPITFFCTCPLRTLLPLLLA